MKYFYLDCDVCETETQVVISTDIDDDPYHCPMCGTEIRAEMIDELNDSED